MLHTEGEVPNTNISNTKPNNTIFTLKGVNITAGETAVLKQVEIL